MKEIAPDVDIDNLSASFPDNEKPIESPSISSTVTVKTLRIFSSIEDEEIKSLNVGGSFTLTTSTLILAVADVPSMLTVYSKLSLPKKFSFGV